MDIKTAPEPFSKGSLVKTDITMHAPRHLEDGGSLTPSEWGKGGKHFSVGKNSAGAGTSVSTGESVNLTTGQIECKGKKS